MRSLKGVNFIFLFLILSLSCNLLSPNSQTNDVKAGNISQGLASLPGFDPNAPLLSPGATSLRALAADEPAVMALVDDVEMVERAALKAAITEVKMQFGISDIRQNFPPLAVSPVEGSGFVIPLLGRPLVLDVAIPLGEGLIAANRSSYSDSSPLLGDGVFIGGFTSLLGDMGIDMPAFPTRSVPPHTETVDGVTSNMSLEMGKGEDGSTHFGMGLQTEGVKNGVSIKTELTANLDGQRCPTADGQVSFTIKAHLSTESGGTALTNDLTTFVRATVNDNAEIVSSTFDVIQGTNQSKGGRQVYIETGETIKFGSDYSGSTVSNLRVNQKTDNATGDEITNFSSDGHAAAEAMGIISLEAARTTWINGGCVKIVAASPGTVSQGSTSTIPVNVVSRFDGSNTPSKLAVEFTGEKSIDPTSLARTPGTLIYTAPNETGKSAIILLTATSKRGKAKLELTADTGGQSYTVSGESNGVNFSGTICSIEKGFGLDATYPGGTANVAFAPVGNNVVNVDGGGNGCVQTGAGTYTLSFQNDGTGTLTWTTTDTLTCPGTPDITRTETFTVQLLPASAISCP